MNGLRRDLQKDLFLYIIIPIFVYLSYDGRVVEI